VTKTKTISNKKKFEEDHNNQVEVSIILGVCCVPVIPIMLSFGWVVTPVLVGCVTLYVWSGVPVTAKRAGRKWHEFELIR